MINWVYPVVLSLIEYVTGTKMINLTGKVLILWMHVNPYEIRERSNDLFISYSYWCGHSSQYTTLCSIVLCKACSILTNSAEC